MESDFYGLSSEERLALVREAQAKGEPLTIRWASLQPDFGDRWEPRAQAAADWLAGAASVADLGCGTINLEKRLLPDQIYVPVDLAARDDRTIVVDLNKPSDHQRLPQTEACALLGVIEYIYEPEQLIAAVAARYRQVVTTYNVHDGAEDVDRRLANGWVNHFTVDRFVRLFNRHGFGLGASYRLEGELVQHIFDFRAVGSSPLSRPG